ncbi:MAG: hypothetical protein WAX69_16690, partial [Victivallales bacterium]
MKSNIIICCLLLSAFISSADDSLIKFVFDTISVSEIKRDDGIIRVIDINIDGVFDGLRNKCKTKDVEKYALSKLKEMDKDDDLFNQLLLKTYLFFGEEGLRFLKDKLDKNNYGIRDVTLKHLQEKLQVISMAKKIKPKNNIEKTVLDRIINYAPADCDLLPPNPDDYFTFVLKFKQDDAELKIWCLVNGAVEKDEYIDSIIVSLNKNKGEALYFSYSYGFDRKEIEEYTESLRPTLKPDSQPDKPTVKDDKQPAPPFQPPMTRRSEYLPPPVGRSVGGSLLRRSPPERKAAADEEAAAFPGKCVSLYRIICGDYATRWPSLWDVIISAFAHLPPSQS